MELRRKRGRERERERERQRLEEEEGVATALMTCCSARTRSSTVVAVVASHCYLSVSAVLLLLLLLPPSPLVSASQAIPASTSLSHDLEHAWESRDSASASASSWQTFVDKDPGAAQAEWGGGGRLRPSPRLWGPTPASSSRSNRVISRRALMFAAVPGSYPPRCTAKCGNCIPCKPVHVPVPPGRMVTTMEYYPEAWRCKCGNVLYMP